ncbi:hypothetical protein EFQ99_26650 [Rhizobium vallis]|uniref:Probable branched-chain-amino-acid aminotransferase n=1 Tax=Rhizobium vallis TaxID=634290 RepID=A0A432PDG0_9HYPH|nr:hypothetical protein [Rhizobium vallis]RUM21392.1 hypothetical protein EFQ99_26650 [Rhizobium vallis]
MQEKLRPVRNSDAIRDFPLRLWIKRNGDNNQQAWRAGAEILGFKVPCCVEELDAATVELLKRPGVRNAYIRPIAWRGSEMMSVSARRK